MYCLRFIIVVYYIIGLLFEKNIVEIWHSVVSYTKNTLLLTAWSPRKPICSQLKVTSALLSMRLIFGELKDNHNSFFCIKGSLQVWWQCLTADITLQERLYRYRYRGVHNWKYHDSRSTTNVTTDVRYHNGRLVI